MNFIKLLLSFIFFFSSLVSRADEGMWLPLLLKQLNEKDMQARGLKLTAEDIYSINKTSLKDAIVHFGGGCTGEIVSGEGLLLTNHHCGYGQIQSHSSVKKDYLTDGFWAMSRNEELPNPGLTATFIIRMEDVTKPVLEGVTENLSETERDSIININIKKITDEAIKDTHYGAYIRPFYNGNEYYMFITETFKDVRLVGAPPSSIGKFGGDTDNWMWPRHTGDFSLFRIYAGKDNKPAEYSPENVPFKPRHFLPVSVKGVKENDFTMVYGFPGRTNEYLTSYAVDIIMNVSNPAKINIREKRLKAWDENMKTSDEVRIQYAAKYASLSNYYKKWIGETRGLKKLNAVEKKRQLEQEFQRRVNNNPEWKKKYAHILPEYEKLYKELGIYQHLFDYHWEALVGVELLSYSRVLNSLVEASKQPGCSPQTVDSLISIIKKNNTRFYKNYNVLSDKKVFAELMALYYDKVDKKHHPAALTEAYNKYKGDFSKMAEEIYSKSILTSEEKMNSLLEKYKPSDYKSLENDPAYKLMSAFNAAYTSNVYPNFTGINKKLNKLNRTYMEALRVVIPEKKYYPDANSTLRVAYGKAEGYQPRDGVNYHYITTLEGVMEKADSTNEEFIVPKKLAELYNKKDYGIYGINGTMPVSFIASNHTTGGNSGSPVIDGEGNLIGTNYDRNWEGTMSDIMYDPERVRNIILDVRYTLFIIDKFAGATHLVKEMKVVE